MSGSTTTGGGMGVESETLIGEVARILMVVEYIIRHSPRRRALHSIAGGVWSLNNYSAIARAGGLRPA
jgi:hypothetical protein